MSKHDEKITRRMVTLAIQPYLDSDRKMRGLYRRAVMEEFNEAAEATALELLRIRHQMRATQTVLEAMGATER